MQCRRVYLHLLLLAAAAAGPLVLASEDSTGTSSEEARKAAAAAAAKAAAAAAAGEAAGEAAEGAAEAEAEAAAAALSAELGYDDLSGFSPLLDFTEDELPAKVEHAATQLQQLAKQARETLNASLKHKQSKEEETKINNREQFATRKDALDQELSKYKTAVTLFAARLSHMQHRLTQQAATVMKLGDSFAVKSEAAVAFVQNQSRPFEVELKALEDKVESLLSPKTGRMFQMLADYRQRLQDAAAAELVTIEKEVSSLVEHLKEANNQLEELLQLSDDAGVLSGRSIHKVADKMGNRIQFFEVLAQQELAKLAEQQQQCALKEIEEFQAKLAGMHLMEHVLETLVAKFASQLTEYKERKKVSRALTLMDLSAAFAGPNPQSVCSVLTHLVHQQKAAEDVAVIFVYGVNPPKASGLPADRHLVVPSPSILRAAAASWAARTKVYGYRATSYSVVRIETSLVEVFTVPYLESEHFSLDPAEELRVTTPSDFAAKLADAVTETNLSSSSDAPFSLVVYLGQLQEDQIKPPITRNLSHNRVLYVQHLVNLDPRSKDLAAVWERLQTQLHFVDTASSIVKEGISKGEAVQLTVRRLDVQIFCFAAQHLEPPPCRRDPHLREAIHYLKVRLTKTAQGFVLPDDSVLVAALTSLVRRIYAGGASCPVIVSTAAVKKRHFWQRKAYTAAAEILTLDAPETSKGSRLSHVGDTSNSSTEQSVEGSDAAAAAEQQQKQKQKQQGRKNSACLMSPQGALCPTSTRTALETKGTLGEAVAALAKTAEGAVLLAEPWTRGYTLYVHVCVSGSNNC